MWFFGFANRFLYSWKTICGCDHALWLSSIYHCKMEEDSCHQRLFWWEMSLFHLWTVTGHHWKQHALRKLFPIHTHFPSIEIIPASSMPVFICSIVLADHCRSCLYPHHIPVQFWQFHHRKYHLLQIAWPVHRSTIPLVCMTSMAHWSITHALSSQDLAISAMLWHSEAHISSIVKYWPFYAVVSIPQLSKKLLYVSSSIIVNIVHVSNGISGLLSL